MQLQVTADFSTRYTLLPLPDTASLSLTSPQHLTNLTVRFPIYLVVPASMINIMMSKFWRFLIYYCPTERIILLPFKQKAFSIQFVQISFKCLHWFNFVTFLPHGLDFHDYKKMHFWWKWEIANSSNISKWIFLLRQNKKNMTKHGIIKLYFLDILWRKRNRNLVTPLMPKHDLLSSLSDSYQENGPTNYLLTSLFTLSLLFNR